MRTPSLGVAAKQALLAAVTEAAGDDGIRAVVLTGTGRVFTAGQDLREHADALREAGRAAGPTLAYATAKRAIRQAWTSSWPDVLAAEARDQAALGATADHRGAVDAFLDKRRPEFTGRE